MKRLTGIFLVLTFVLIARATHAETPSISVLGPVTIVRSDEVIPVDVVITSGGKTMNAADITLTYPSSMLTVDRIQREETVFELWPEEPSWDEEQGTIHLVGGHPNGLVMINARIATIYFRARQAGTAKIQLDENRSGLYLNDGAGTKVQVGSTETALTIHDSLYPGIPLSSSSHATPETWSTKPLAAVSWVVEEGMEYSYVFSLDARTVPDDAPETIVGEVQYDQLADGRYYFSIKQRPQSGLWSEVTQRRFLIDGTPPEPFQITHPDPATVDGRSVLTWVSRDTMSGIERSTLTVGGQDVGLVTSPLALKPAWNGKTVIITVSDQAGNQQTSAWRSGQATSTVSWWWITVVVALMVAAIIVTVVSGKRRR